jgi:hypothetical protein
MVYAAMTILSNAGFYKFSIEREVANAIANNIFMSQAPGGLFLAMKRGNNENNYQK